MNRIHALFGRLGLSNKTEDDGERMEDFIFGPRVEGRGTHVISLDAVDESNYSDVGRFHEKFDLQFVGYLTVGGYIMPSPRLLDQETYEFRNDFMQEELDEFAEAHADGDLPKMADALIDLVYVAMGTAHMMGLPWQELWDEVQRANMSKERAVSRDDSRSKRKNSLDVVKPDGWTPPDIDGVLKEYVK